MKIDPLAPQLLIDYDYCCRRFGPLAFSDFVTLWHAADVVMKSAIAERLEPCDVTDLIFPGAVPLETVH